MIDIPRVSRDGRGVLKTVVTYLVLIPKWVSVLLAVLILVGLEWIPKALLWPARVLWLLLVISAVVSWARGIGTARRAGFGLLALLVGLALAYLAAEAGAWALIRMRPHLGSPPLVLTDMQRDSIVQALSDEAAYTQLDPALGWKPRPGSVSGDGLGHINADGIRALRRYPRDLGGIRERVLTFGDSYTHGNDVDDAQTWQHAAEQARPGLEMLNFGVGGYGMTQAFLRYEAEVENYEATGAILGCMTDDLRRSLNVYYPFRFSPPSLAPSASGSPYAGLDAAGRLEFHPNPLGSPEAYRALLEAPDETLRSLARREALLPEPGATPLLDLWRVGGAVYAEPLEAAGFWLRKQTHLLAGRRKPTLGAARRAPSVYEPGNVVFEVNLQIFERFATTARARGLKPRILWFPSPKDVAAFNRGRPEPVYAAYLAAMAERGIEVVDVLTWLREDFATAGGIDLDGAFHRGHYTPPVNARIGQRLAAMSWRIDGEG